MDERSTWRPQTPRRSFPPATVRRVPDEQLQLGGLSAGRVFLVYADYSMVGEDEDLWDIVSVHATEDGAQRRVAELWALGSPRLVVKERALED